MCASHLDTRRAMIESAMISCRRPASRSSLHLPLALQSITGGGIAPWRASRCVVAGEKQQRLWHPAHVAEHVQDT